MNERNNNGYHKQNPNQFHNRSSYNKPYDKIIECSIKNSTNNSKRLNRFQIQQRIY